MDFIKKLLAFITGVPALAGVVKKMFSTGRIDPVETLNALSNFSPDFKKISELTEQTAKNGGGVAEVVSGLQNMGTLNLAGQTINTGTLSQDLRKHDKNGMGKIFADIIDGLSKMSKEEIQEFGDKAKDLANWQ